VNQKLLIVVLVVLVVIFVITIGIGGCHGSGKRKTDDERSVGALKGLQGKRFLVIGDRTTTDPPNCAPRGAVQFTLNGTCTITFQKRAFFRTATRVSFFTSGALQVVVDPKNGPRQDQTISANDCFGTAVDHAGGTMRLTPLLAPRTITLLRAACPKK
jgi:hypothetical protein